MHPTLSRQIDQVLLSAQMQPTVSIILPFDPKMSTREEIQKRIQSAVAKVEFLVTESIDQPFTRLVLQKLRSIIRNLDFSTFRKSLAIYVSPVFEKVLYLNIEVEEKIMVDDSFDIRDLVYAKKEVHNLLLLVVGEQRNTVWFFDGLTLKMIQSGAVYGYAHGNAAADTILSQLLPYYPFPVLVTGAEKRLLHYKTYTKQLRAISSWLPEPVQDMTAEQLSAVITPVISDWSNISNSDIRNRIACASTQGLLSAGFTGCLQKAGTRTRQLLIVEINYIPSPESDLNPLPEEDVNQFSCVKNRIDDMIERVLSAGGNVEFVDDGTLFSHGHIVLINRN